MFLENKSKLCKCRANKIFWRIRLRQPVCSYTLITIIRMISWAGMSVHKTFIAMFCDYCFLSIFDASINFIRCFPLIIKRKKKGKKTKKIYIPNACPRILFASIISTGLHWLLLSLLTSHIQYKRVGIYYLTHYRMQVVLFLFKNNSFQLVLFSITLYFYLLIHYSWCSELITGHCDKTKILNSTNMIF